MFCSVNFSLQILFGYFFLSNRVKIEKKIKRFFFNIKESRVYEFRKNSDSSNKNAILETKQIMK